MHHNKKQIVPIRFLFLLILLSALFSCGDKAESLEDRVLSRWHALIDKDWERAYAYETPEYRETYDIERFKNSYGGAVVWNSIEFVSSNKINEELVDVNLNLNVTYNNNLPFASPIQERWVLKNSKWWHVNKN